MTLQAKARFNFTTGLEDILIGKSHIEWQGEKLTEDEFTWQPPVTGTVYGTLFNFREQLDTWKKEFQKDPYKHPPKRPVLYIKPRNTLNAHLKDVVIPNSVNEVEMNGTVGVVIGKTATQVRPEEAFDFVGGYTVVNDVTIPHDSVYRPAIKQKARDGFCPIGPWVVAKENVLDIDNLMIWTFKNDELIHMMSTKDLVRSIPELISDITSFMTLQKDDVLLIGIPSDPPRAKAGDTIRIEIDQIGHLENRIVLENSELIGGEPV